MPEGAPDPWYLNDGEQTRKTARGPEAGSSHLIQKRSVGLMTLTPIGKQSFQSYDGR